MSTKKKYVKLGEKASSYFDPTTRMQVAPGEAVEIELKHRQSKRFVRALKSGHLDYVDSDEVNELTVVNAKAESKKVEKETNWKDEVEMTEKGLMALKLAQLKELALDKIKADPDWDMTEAEIGESTKKELVEFILLEDEEDEDEDEEN